MINNLRGMTVKWERLGAHSVGKTPDYRAYRGHRPLAVASTLGALGVVYGDIGTSPLYAFKEVTKAASAGGMPTSGAVIGVVSLILWSLILIISRPAQ